MATARGACRRPSTETYSGSSPTCHCGRARRRSFRRCLGFAGGEVLAPTASAPAEAAATGVFFTGGVDSFHALLTNLETVKALIFVQGFDIPLTDQARLDATARLLDHVARACNLRVLT